MKKKITIGGNVFTLDGPMAGVPTGEYWATITQEHTIEDIPECFITVAGSGHTDRLKPCDVIALIVSMRNRKIEAIKFLRSVMPVLGLKEAKEMVEQIISDHDDCPF